MFYTNVVQHKNKIFHLGYDDFGKKFIDEERYSPHIALSSTQESPYKTIYGENVDIRHFDTIGELRKYIKEYKGLFPIYDDIDPKYQFINERYKDNVSYDFNKLTIIVYDIETLDIYDEHKGFPKPEDAPVPIVSIVLKDYHKKNIYVLSMAKYNDEQRKMEVDGRVYYRYCATEEELLKRTVTLINKLQPDILTGWNNNGFDDPYLINRVKMILGDEACRKLSPCNIIPTSMVKEVEKQGRKQREFSNNWFGISSLDMYKLYMKYNVPANGQKENYKLGFIGEAELGEDKVAYEEFDNLLELFYKDPQKMVEYNIQDVELVCGLNKKFKYLELQLFLAYYAKCNYEDVFSPVKTWDVAIYNYLKSIDKVCPPSVGEVESEEYVGAYVKDPIPGIYKWVVSFDVNSLYPSLLRMFNGDSSTIIDETIEVDLKKVDPRLMDMSLDLGSRDYCVSASGNKFHKKFKGTFPILIEKLYAERVETKSEMLQLISSNGDKDKISSLSTKEQGIKVFLNSLYGCLANKHSRFFDIRIATSITLTGQMAIQWLESYTNKFFKDNYNSVNNLTYIDTDSCRGDSVIIVDGLSITIADFYDKTKGKLLKNDIFNGDYIKVPDSIYKTASYDGNSEKIVNNRIKYIMKHKVKKRMFKIKHGDDEVVITEDHSLMVLRDNILIEIKPNSLQKGDKIIKIKNMSHEIVDDYTIEDLGIYEDWVYDLEVEHTHTFFANNILLHNSNYFTLDKIIPKNLTKAETIDWINGFCENKLSKVIDNAFDELQDYLHAKEKVLVMKRELICESVAWKKKKMYAMMVWDKEGKRYKEPQLKVKGIEIVRASTPAIVRDYLKDTVKLMLTDESKLPEYIKNVEDKYSSLSPEQIAFPRSANNQWKWKDEKNIYKKGTPIAVKGALTYNHWVDDNNLSLTKIEEGDKVKYCYLRTPNNIYNKEVVSFIRKFPLDKKYVDYKKMLDKSYLDVVYSLADSFKIKIKTVENVNDIF